MNRINSSVAVMTARERASQPLHLREIPILTLTPTREITEISPCQASQMPLTLNVLLKGIGVSAGRGSELLSYLAFEPSFLKSVLEAGYYDTLQRKEAILKFFEDAD